MSGKAARILLSEKQLDILQKITRSTTASQRLVQRARVILFAFERRRNEEIADEVKLHRRQVGLWRRRWKESFDALVSIECREAHAKLCRAVEDVLSDAPRSGAYGNFTAEQITLIMAIACEPPEL
ncbi:MAG: helix-turn-helix domain-containing protein, partial [Fuerstiella sp.]